MDIFNMDDPLGAQAQTPDLGNLKTVCTSKLMVVIFVVDCSKTMEGERINSVNSALQELRFTLTQMKTDNNLDLRMAIMSFASTAKWELKLTPVEEVNLSTIRTRPGLTEFGAVFHELNKVLTEDGFMKYQGKVAPPAIMFLTDGEPEDDYQSDLDELMKNPWFANASRSAVLIGDAYTKDAARQALARFVVDSQKDIVGTDDSTVIIQKINQATMHVVAGDSMGLASAKPKDSAAEPEPVQEPEPIPTPNPVPETDPFMDNPFGAPDTFADMDNPFGGSNVSQPQPAIDNPFGGPSMPSVDIPFNNASDSADPFKTLAPDMDNPFAKKYDDGNDPFSLPSEDVGSDNVDPEPSREEIYAPPVTETSFIEDTPDPFAGSFSGGDDPFDGLI